MQWIAINHCTALNMNLMFIKHIYIYIMTRLNDLCQTLTHQNNGNKIAYSSFYAVTANLHHHTHLVSKHRKLHVTGRPFFSAKNLPTTHICLNRSCRTMQCSPPFMFCGSLTGMTYFCMTFCKLSIIPSSPFIFSLLARHSASLFQKSSGCLQ